MNKRVILISGTPATGKTTLAKALAAKLSAQYINLTDYAKTNNLILSVDEVRKSSIVDEKKMKQKLAETIKALENETVIVDGHFAQAVVPKTLATHVFVLRRNPKELKKYMEKLNWPENKIYENLSAEILDVCLVEALQMQKGKVCEIDASGKTVDELTVEVLSILDGNKKCYSGFTDWLEKLEREGLTDEYLKS
jgi:adenylate kinase